jgi:porin
LIQLGLVCRLVALIVAPLLCQGAAVLAESINGQQKQESIPANPVPIEMFAGTGELGQLLGLKPDSGLRLGGSAVGEGSNFLQGSFAPGSTFGNGLLVLQLEANLERIVGLKDTKISVTGLQFNGSPSNFYSGAIQGFTNLPSTPPFNRTELYSYWISKGFPSNHLHVRFGKQVANTLFNNVVLGNLDLPSRSEQAVSGLIYSPLYENPTLFGRVPSSYNSALGLTVQWFPGRNGNTYVNYGVFDGNGAKPGYQTGLRAPWINNYLFQIAEFGLRWNLGPMRLPAKFAVGGWHQSGELQTPESAYNRIIKGSNAGTANGASGMYLYGTHRLWYRKPWKDPSGVSMFYQFGYTNSQASLVHQYAGIGLTAFGLIEGRPRDNFGLGLSYSKPNPHKNPEFFVLPWLFPGRYNGRPLAEIETPELMVQLYYQFSLAKAAYLEPVLTYIPKPSLIGTPSTLVFTMRLIKQF